MTYPIIGCMTLDGLKLNKYIIGGLYSFRDTFFIVVKVLDKDRFVACWGHEMNYSGAFNTVNLFDVLITDIFCDEFTEESQGEGV